MATTPHSPSGTHTASIGVPALPAVTRILSRFPRPQVESFIEIALELLDTIDGDADCEVNGDELDESGDDRDVSWLEWHQRSRRAQRANAEMLSTAGLGDLEDDEDDDPGGGNVEDVGEGIDEREPEEQHCLAYGLDQTAGIINLWAGRERVPDFECCEAR